MTEAIFAIGGMLIHAGLWCLGAGSLLALVAVLAEAAARA